MMQLVRGFPPVSTMQIAVGDERLVRVLLHVHGFPPVSTQIAVGDKRDWLVRWCTSYVILGQVCPPRQRPSSPGLQWRNSLPSSDSPPLLSTPLPGLSVPSPFPQELLKAKEY